MSGRSMTPEAFRAAVDRLFSSQDEAAQVLRVSSRARVSEWCTGARAVPPYVAAHVSTLLRYAPKVAGK